VLKGTPPSGMPVQQPTRIGLVVNQRTARALDLALPPILERADRLIW
jgi:putative ABC transport system substrate-binding protein